MLYGLKKVNKTKACCRTCKKPLTNESSYGGYGLFCNKACAERKDADRAAEAKKIEHVHLHLAIGLVM